MRRVAIIGAAGRDFHVYNTVYRGSREYKVVAFLMTQIPIPNRRYPPSLSGVPEGVPIYTWKSYEELTRYLKELRVDEAVLAYSDLLYDEVGHIISAVLASGATFKIHGPNDTYLNSIRPVFAVTATRTGAGKSTVSKEVVKDMASRGLKVAVVRHPMPYRDLEEGVVEIYKRPEDLDKLTFEEREEYEQYVEMGVPVLAGVDYSAVLKEAELLGDVILWDGGNNDFPFFRPNYMVVVTDARRAGHEVGSFPGELNLRLADAVIVTKVSDAGREKVEEVVANVKKTNPKASITKADLEVYVDRDITGKKVLVIEDAPTVTHGGLPYAAGYLAAVKYGAVVVDPRPYAVGVIKRVYEEYSTGPVLPSLGYTPEQRRDLEETIKRADADVVLLGTPAKIERVIKIDKPIARVSWRLKILEGPTIKDLVDEFLERALR
ncbi:cyclic 2,3-diphosphoglycerate synthase [Pyrobaculum aerophilum]|uniref:cyclic 2,3-diphosphoglycerate synthase n=1 Tax=Pyrobaculum aerophilum TaxID=13773 RepID=UPI0023F3F415|nr:cyclic 2,3-diphosphoglycerate synthase [Pyrobaculum aerophilum]MCX8136562.1 cyclic 2,3-diphosphoglycerate synthase [Pyrobaculum aerophilum]